LALDPHVPWAVLRIGKFVGKIEFWNSRLDTFRLVRFAEPLRFDAFRPERPEPSPKKISAWTVPAWSVAIFATPEILIEL
jgi:hypothetical protein